MGTPVVALGRGHVFFKGRVGGFGNCVKIKHPAGYVTYYGHLARFAKNLDVGQSVEQGEIIGYVGSTGVSTGPHLDFRVKHDGSFVNPLRLEAVTADRLKGRELAEFRKLTAKRFSLIDASRLNIARRSDNNKPQI
jgi:murein DD-endopeptidase MepM/ murein hydrolase activator NlpD